MENLNTSLKEVRQRLAAIYGNQLKKVILFGSQARGEAGLSSDVDLMVVLEGPIHAGKEIARTGELTSELSLKHDITFSCVFVSADRYLQEQSPLLLNVRREGVTV